MSQKQRLKQLEKKTHGQFLAFFALPRDFCNRKEIELQLWNDYVGNGNYRTTGINEVVALIDHFQREFGHKKTEHLAISDKTFGNMPIPRQL